MNNLLCLLAIGCVIVVVQAAPMPDDAENDVYLLEPIDAANQHARVRRDAHAFSPDGFHEGPRRGVYQQPGIFGSRSYTNRKKGSNRQRRASNAYPYAIPSAAAYPSPYPYPVPYPVDGFYEGSQPIYSQPAPYQGQDINQNDPLRNTKNTTKKPTKKPTATDHRRQEFVGPQGPPPPSKGNKYVYQPLFKYKATQHKHHKLFVPNIFG